MCKVGCVTRTRSLALTRAHENTHKHTPRTRKHTHTDAHSLTLSHAQRRFTPGNPTGHHRLDLSKQAERDVALHLMRCKNTQQVEEDAEREACSHRVGGKRVKFDRSWRNASLNRKPFAFDPAWVLPRTGTLELDFVEIIRPPEKAEAVSNKTLHLMLRDEWADPCDALQLVDLVRVWSNQLYFSCAQVQTFLALVQRAEMMRQKQVQRQMLSLQDDMASSSSVHAGQSVTQGPMPNQTTKAGKGKKEGRLRGEGGGKSKIATEKRGGQVYLTSLEEKLQRQVATAEGDKDGIQVFVPRVQFAQEEVIQGEEESEKQCEEGGPDTHKHHHNTHEVADKMDEGQERREEEGQGDSFVRRPSSDSAVGEISASIKSALQRMTQVPGVHSTTCQPTCS